VTDARRLLPAVSQVLELAGVQALLARAPRSLLADAIRNAIDAVRRDPALAPVEDDGWVSAVEAALARLEQPSLRAVLNATGVVLHTNLGRAPLPPAAIEAIVRTAGGATNLEYDLDEGRRGSRYDHCASLLRELTGAGDALVVNNGAAALVLALNTVSDGKEAIVSRGELIEIGGSFRVPDIMARSGAILREVGTTNRTHVDDYRRVLGERTGAVVKVHRSNFEQRGFVAEASVRELVPIAREASVPLLLDLGSGLLLSLDRHGLSGEPTVADALRDGATLVVMSGDKMLGGPQAGILVGDPEVMAACRRNPLTRALRVDKLTLAALEATLAIYRDPPAAIRDIPVLAMLTAPVESVRARAAMLQARLTSAGVVAEIVPTEASVGGGAFPTARIASFAVALAGDAERLERALRSQPVPVIGRINDGRILLDLRSVPVALDATLAQAVLQAVAP
jgi:L-seryl-tRNA(Ser) seleniumtransferase